MKLELTANVDRENFIITIHFGHHSCIIELFYAFQYIYSEEKNPLVYIFDNFL